MISKRVSAWPALGKRVMDVTAVDGLDDGQNAPALYLVWYDTASNPLKLDTF